MNRLGCYGLVLGAAIGSLFVALFVLVTRPSAPSAAPPPATIPPDITIFISEQSLSHMASETISRPALINFDKNGQMRVTTRTRIGQLEPVVQIAVLLEMQGTEVVSRLRWTQVGFLYIPATWLPPEVQQTTALIGQTINTQIPPDFSLTGLSTTNEGINFQLKWVGR